MTTATEQRTPGPARASGSWLRRELIAEWTKLRSVRSTMWSLLLLAVLTLGFTALFTALTVSQWDQTDESDRAQVVADPVSTILGSGLFLGQLTICVLGVMVMTSEYSTGMIRASLLAEPIRWRMLVAKSLVFGSVVLVIGEIVAFASYAIGSSVLHSKAPVSLGDDGVLRAVIGGGLYLCVLGLFALAIGAIVRHTAGSITGVIGFILVLSPLAQLLPGDIGEYVHAYLPAEAGQLIAYAHTPPDGVLSPWEGFGIFCLWTVALLAVATYLLERRDA